MPIQERSYGGKLFRPTPETHIEEDGSFGVIATPWGSRGAAKRTIEILTDYILSARHDMEATSPFQKLTCLSALANNCAPGSCSPTTPFTVKKTRPSIWRALKFWCSPTRTTNWPLPKWIPAFFTGPKRFAVDSAQRAN